MSETPRPVSPDSARHYTWGDGCDGWHLLASEGLSVIEERMPAGTAETRHRHGTARQFFFVLSGTLTLEIEGAIVTVAAGNGCEVMPGEAHQVFNRGGAAAEFLVISQPPAQGDREAAYGPP
jgi:mannose-6-phosphate isomerase-like protein (cupin superfamily)